MSFIGVYLAHYEIFYAQFCNDVIKTNFHFLYIIIQIMIISMISYVYLIICAGMKTLIFQTERLLDHISENNTIKN